MDLLGEGKEWPEATVTNPAYWPVSAAADAAGGDPILSRRRQRDTLLKLIKEAPMETN
jgi:hypothetical protein